MKQGLLLVLALLVGLAAGWLLPRAAPPPPDPVPEDWVARVGDSYIDAELFRDEMRRRGGERPGTFQDGDSRRALLDAMLYRQVLAESARRDGLHQTPELRRAIDQVLADRYLDLTLRQRQEAITVSEDELRAYWREHADDYSLPPRRRIALVQVSVPEEAPDAAWEQAEARVRQALERVRQLELSVPHFGDVAVEFSDDQASRYRGGVVGWITEGQAGRYRLEPAVMEAAEALEQPGDIAGPLRGDNGWYLVRLVERDAGQTREFAELADGLRQRLMQQRLAAENDRFREQMLASVDIEIREARLAEIDPLSAPLDNPTPQPPALPAN